MNTPDPNQATRFLEALAPGENQHTFQTFPDQKDGANKHSLTRILHGSFQQHLDQLANLNSRGAGVFVTVNATDGLGRKTTNIQRVRALFVDLDGAPLAPVLGHRDPPDIVVESSPGRWHCYWRVEDCPLEQFTPAQKRLITLFNADKSVHDLPRVMRLPGFFHLKTTPFMTRLLVPVQGGVQ